MNYLQLQSSLHRDDTLAQQATDFFSAVSQQLDLPFAEGDLSAVAQEPIAFLYISTGGTAGLAKAALDQLDAPVVLVTSGSQNSLSASMETLTYMAQQGKMGTLLHGNLETLTQQIATLVQAANAKKALEGARLALVGAPSDWLISTQVDYAKLKATTGLDLVEIPMEELVTEIHQTSYPQSQACDALFTKGFDPDQVLGALHIYGAFTRLKEKYQLDGMSVRCFDLLTLVKNTGCLGLALLNAKGIFGGCEGDLPSLVSMAILGKLSGQPVFQCNPSRVDDATNEIVFAHCTLPLNLAEDYQLDTHFESGIGVALAGDIPLGEVTIFKASGDLGHYFLSKGEVVANLREPDLCRTQIRVKCDVPVQQFLRSHVGNHYLVCPGNWVDAVNTYFDMVHGTLGQCPC